MNGDTQIFKKAKSTLERHKQTALGGIGGVGVASLFAIIWPFLTDIKSSFDEVDDLKIKITVLETKVDMLLRSHEANPHQ
jgi:hypothetical protein